jgi:hypothetical protein
VSFTCRACGRSRAGASGEVCRECERTQMGRAATMLRYFDLSRVDAESIRMLDELLIAAQNGPP